MTDTLLFLDFTGRLSLYLPTCMTVWGMISSLFPSALFLISKWYERASKGANLWNDFFITTETSQRKHRLRYLPPYRFIIGGANIILGHAVWRFCATLFFLTFHQQLAK
ncbi:hypothetical protein BDR07DRAFT_321145 [Suillus spraguei]|nr:hypothetical protein BDR07DRAFT_321145 [Suillus spraguei]